MVACIPLWVTMYITVVNVIPLYHTALYVHILLFNERVIAGTLVMITTGRCLFLSGPSLPVPVELVSGDMFIDPPECVDAPEC